ncbi:tRNA-dependent cyclodipeptide synthase [Gammaproteobacteria bacterium]|nr:tRNA-dependent cyclodipeptide synthase [Gammaproteobacteria bacterium]
MGNPSSLNIILCTSFANPNFYGRRLFSVLHFAMRTYNNIILVTPGHLYRHCYPASAHASEVRLQQALNYEEKYKSQNFKPLLPLLKSSQIKVATWSEIIITSDYQEQLRQFLNYYQANKVFRAAIDKSTDHFVKRNNSSCSLLEQKMLIKQFTLFLLEEFAFFTTMAKQGYPVLAYPGSLIGAPTSITTQFHEQNMYPDAPEYLKKVAYITMVLKKSGRGAKVGFQAE